MKTYGIIPILPLADTQLKFGAFLNFFEPILLVLLKNIRSEVAPPQARKTLIIYIAIQLWK